jgi:hypothetical protein
MARALESAMQSAVAAASIRPFIAFELELDSGTLRYWGGHGTLTINGDDYTGAGVAISMGPVTEVAANKATGTVYRLSGVPSALVSTVFNEATQNRVVRTWFGAFTSTGAVVVSPFKLFEGFLDVPEIEENGETAEIRCSAESEAITKNRRRVRRYTHEDQQLDYPGDKGFEFVPGLQDVTYERRG